MGFLTALGRRGSRGRRLALGTGAGALVAGGVTAAMLLQAPADAATQAAANAQAKAFSTLRGIQLPATMYAAPAARAAQGTGCAAYDFVTVRGTFEPGPWDPVVLGPTATQVRAKVPGGKTYDLNYPADALPTSELTGVTNLANYLNSEAAACPNEKLVVGGYSQGAWVVGDALAENKLSAGAHAHLTAVVLFGDPRFVPNKPYDAGGYRSGVSGVYPRTLFGGSLDSYGTVLRDYCRADDLVCQGLGGNVIGHVMEGSNAGPAAAFVEGRLAA